MPLGVSVPELYLKGSQPHLELKASVAMAGEQMKGISEVCKNCLVVLSTV